MTNNDKVKNALSEKQGGSAEVGGRSPKNLKDHIDRMRPQIAAALPAVITPERFTRIALTAVSANAQLANAEPMSFLGAMMQAAQLGVEPNTPLGQAYLIPFRNNRKNIIEVQFQLGYKGLIDLAYRSGEFKTIYARAVYAGDEFEYAYGLEPKLNHVPKEHGDTEKPTHYYAVFTLVNGGFGFEVMSYNDVFQHATRFSQALRSGKETPWKSDFDAMAMKTLIKRVLKYAPIKVDFMRAISQDETVKSEISPDMTLIPDEAISYQVEDENAADHEEIEGNDAQ